MALRHLKIPITEAPPLLRGLVQHVLSPCRYSVAINQLDCLQALRDKTLYVELNRCAVGDGVRSVLL